MTSNAFFMALAAGAFAVLCVVAWHLVILLKQARRTAQAAELFLEATRPRVEAATDRLHCLIDRVDRILSKAEEGQSGFSAVLNGVTQGIVGWCAGGKFISTISAVVSGIMETWKAFRTTGQDSTAGATPAGGGNE